MLQTLHAVYIQRELIKIACTYIEKLTNNEEQRAKCKNIHCV